MARNSLPNSSSIEVANSSQTSVNTQTSSSSPPLSSPSISIDVPLILQNIFLLNIKVITECPDDLAEYQSMIQNVSSFPLKDIKVTTTTTNTTSQFSFKLHEINGKSDYNLYLHHQRGHYKDEDSYYHFIPTTFPLIVRSLILIYLCSTLKLHPALISIKTFKT